MSSHTLPSLGSHLRLGSRAVAEAWVRCTTICDVPGYLTLLYWSEWVWAYSDQPHGCSKVLSLPFVKKGQPYKFCVSALFNFSCGWRRVCFYESYSLIQHSYYFLDFLFLSCLQFRPYLWAFFCLSFSSSLTFYCVVAGFKMLWDDGFCCSLDDSRAFVYQVFTVELILLIAS